MIVLLCFLVLIIAAQGVLLGVVGSMLKDKDKANRAYRQVVLGQMLNPATQEQGPKTIEALKRCQTTCDELLAENTALARQVELAKLRRSSQKSDRLH